MYPRCNADSFPIIYLKLNRRTQAGDKLVIEEVLGGIEYGEDGNTVVGAKGLSLIYEVRGNATESSSGYEDEQAEDWEEVHRVDISYK